MSVFNQLSHYCSAPPKLAKTQLNYKTFYGIYFTTRTYPCFTELHDMFYANKKKIIPKNLYHLLTYQVLAHWIMGDGTKTYNGITLQTQSYTIEQVVFIINVLIIKLKCSIHMQRGQPTIYISSHSIKRILPKILPYITPGMRYKFNAGYLL